MKMQLMKDKRFRLHCINCGKAFICKADQNIHLHNDVRNLFFRDNEYNHGQDTQPDQGVHHRGGDHDLQEYLRAGGLALTEFAKI